MKVPGAILAAVCLCFIAVAGFSLAEEKKDRASGPEVKVLSAVDVDEKVNGKAARASTVEVTFEPGASSSPHRHPGPVFGYVIEGEFEFRIEGKPKQTLKAGKWFALSASAGAVMLLLSGCGDTNPDAEPLFDYLRNLVFEKEGRKVLVDLTVKEGDADLYVQIRAQ